MPATSTVNYDASAYAMASGGLVAIGTNGSLCVNVGRAASHIILDATGYSP